METNPFRAQRKARESEAAGGPSPERGRGPARPTPAPGPRRWVEERVRGKTWWLRLPVLLILAWILRNHLTRFQHTSIFDGITLAFHEMGHAFFMWFGNVVLTAAGGTIFQLLIPLVAAAYLALKQRDPFGATVGTFWLGDSLVSAGIYAADARAQALPLVSPFGPVDTSSHDWTTILLKFGMISKDQVVGGFLQSSGKAVMAASLLAGAWVLWVMARAHTRPRTPATADARLWDHGEDARLAAFMRGEKVSRPTDAKRLKREARRRRRAGRRGAADEGTGTGGEADGAGRLSGEDERFREFLDRD